MKGWRAGLSGIAGLLLLAAAFALGRATATPEPRGVAPAADARAEALRGELAAQRERARELAAQVAWLQGQIAMLGRDEPEDEPAGPAAAETGTAGAEPGEPEAQWFDEEGLRQLGMPASELARLRDLFERHEMERIELLYRAEREGWADGPRLWRETLRFQLDLREAIGDEDYDVLLYATGRKNRVVMSEILEDSPARRYGFEAGDVVVGYDGKRIYHGRELRKATTEGRRGDWVTVDVMREGELTRIRVQRGPLGVKLRPARILPEALW